MLLKMSAQPAWPTGQVATVAANHTKGTCKSPLALLMLWILFLECL
jgi:hypothetical protein